MKETLLKRIALIDADFIPYYVCHNKKNEQGIVVAKTLEECEKLADELISTILAMTKATHYMMCFTIGKCFRYHINPYYKSNRKHEPISHLKEIKQYLIDEYEGIGDSYYEADDIVATLKKRLGNEAFIVSPDKDILNLAGTHYNAKKNEWKTTDDSEAESYFWRSMIIGDSADGIKGIPGKGPAYANKIFEEHLGVPMSAIVLQEYINHFDEYEGIAEFHKNYMCLKIIDESEQMNFELKLREVEVKEDPKLNEI